MVVVDGSGGGVGGRCGVGGGGVQVGGDLSVPEVPQDGGEVLRVGGPERYGARLAAKGDDVAVGDGVGGVLEDSLPFRIQSYVRVHRDGEIKLVLV